MIKTWWWVRLRADQDVGPARCQWRQRPPRVSPPWSSPLSPSAAPPSSFSLRNNNSTLLCRRTESAERVSVVLLRPALNSSQPELLLTPGKLRSVNWVTLILAVFFAHLDHLRRSPRGGEVGEVGRKKRGGDVLIFLTLNWHQSSAISPNSFPFHHHKNISSQFPLSNQNIISLVWTIHSCLCFQSLAKITFSSHKISHYTSFAVVTKKNIDN